MSPFPPVPPRPLPAPDAAPNAARIWREFVAAVGELPPCVRAAFLLHAVAAAGHGDIGRLLGEPAPTCRAYIAMARAQVQARVAAACAREEDES